jgi:hypothetical protein
LHMDHTHSMVSHPRPSPPPSALNQPSHKASSSLVSLVSYISSKQPNLDANTCLPHPTAGGLYKPWEKHKYSGKGTKYKPNKCWWMPKSLPHTCLLALCVAASHPAPKHHRFNHLVVQKTLE